MCKYLLCGDEKECSPPSLSKMNNAYEHTPCFSIEELACILKRYTNHAPACKRDAIFVRKNDAYIKILFEQIVWLEASRSYCYIHLLDNREIILSCPLLKMESQLPSEMFLRIHRSFVINTRYVDSFVGNQVCIGVQKLPIGLQYKDCIKEHFDFLKMNNHDL